MRAPTVPLHRELLSVPEVAAVLGYGPTQVYAAIKAGTFPIEPVRLWEGAHLRFRRSDVDAFLGRKAAS